VTAEPLLVIADDDPDMRALVRLALEQQYPDAHEVADGRDLFWYLLRSRFAPRGEQLRDLVIVADVCMPEYDCLDVLDAWQDGNSDAPIVIITGLVDEEVRARAARLGATVLQKPFSCKSLRAALDGAARRTSRAGGRAP
jgi:DNA-binding response OmpR family regulator